MRRRGRKGELAVTALSRDTLLLMALEHARPGQAVQALPPDSGPQAAKTVALFKSRDLEVVRLVLPAGRSLPAHQVAGDITIHCLSGRLSLEFDGGASQLEAGELMFLAGGAAHAVTALSDASALVTIALKS